MNRDELLELIPAYVLDALEEDERITVKAFIETDAEAQQLVQDYQAVTSVLPFAAPLHSAPSYLKADLQQRLAKRQNESPPEKIEITQKIIRFPYKILLSSVAAIIIFAVGILLFVNQSSPVEPTRVPRGLILYNEIIQQSSFQQFAVTPTGAKDSSGELVISEDGSQAVLRIAELPTIAENESYQLWLVREDSVESGGLFHWRTGHGPYYIIMLLDHPTDEYIRFGMSIEPENGSPFPDAPSGIGLFRVVIAQAS